MKHIKTKPRNLFKYADLMHKRRVQDFWIKLIFAIALFIIVFYWGLKK